MGQMADKRTKQASSADQNSVLCEALRGVMWFGSALFDAESSAEDREDLGQWMREAFPGDQFLFWRRQRTVPHKSFYESSALLQALRQLVESQSRRAARSRSLLQDPLPQFKRLYRKELLACLPEEETQSPMHLVAWADALSSDRGSQPHAEGDLPLDLSRALKRVGDRVRRETYLFLLGRLLRAVRDPYDAYDPAMVRLSLLLTGIDREAARSHELLTAAAEAWGTEGCQSTALTDGEYRAICAAILGIMHGAAPLSHSRRGDTLSHFLPPAQMRQLRRACAKDDEVAAFLRRLSSWLRRACNVLFSQAAEPERMVKRARGRVGALHRSAREAELSGQPAIAAGLRAMLKLESGLPLDDDDPRLIQEAEEWLQRVHRPSVLAGVRWVITPVEGFAGPAGARVVATALFLAVYVWPDGARPLRPES